MLVKLALILVAFVPVDHQQSSSSSEDVLNLSTKRSMSTPSLELGENLFDVSVRWSVVCFLCDSFEGNCKGSTCVGNACIKRKAFMEDGLVRVQKMCQMSAEPFVESCTQNVLWKGAIGTECTCQTDYCNNTAATSPTVFLLALSSLFYRIFVWNYFA